VLRTQNNTLTLLPSSGVVMSEKEDVPLGTCARYGF